MEPSEDRELRRMRVKVSLPFICLLSMSEVRLNHSPSKSWTISGMLVMSGGEKCGEGSSKKEL